MFSLLVGVITIYEEGNYGAANGVSELYDFSTIFHLYTGCQRSKVIKGHHGITPQPPNLFQLSNIYLLLMSLTLTLAPGCQVGKWRNFKVVLKI